MGVVSREMIIDTMRQYVETKGEFPVSRLINKKSFGFTMHDINKHFGTLSNLAKEMGYIISSGKRTNVLTVDEVLDRCEQIMEIFNIDRFPTITEIGCSGLITPYTIYKLGGIKGLRQTYESQRGKLAADDEIPKREVPFDVNTYAKQQIQETLSTVPDIDISKYEKCRRLGDAV